MSDVYITKKKRNFRMQNQTQAANRKAGMNHEEEQDEMPRQRTTWRLSNINYDFVLLESVRLGISINGALNVMLSELRTSRRQSGGTSTAKLASRKSVQ